VTKLCDMNYLGPLESSSCTARQLQGHEVVHSNSEGGVGGPEKKRPNLGYRPFFLVAETYDSAKGGAPWLSHSTRLLGTRLVFPSRHGISCLFSFTNYCDYDDSRGQRFIHALILIIDSPGVSALSVYSIMSGWASGRTDEPRVPCLQMTIPPSKCKNGSIFPVKIP